ncbi:MAG: hypothetical protein M3R69_16245 [Acidobacteriota bacterium]|nr:hypothetical protein [Acidobacteriota bacterium]
MKKLSGSRKSELDRRVEELKKKSSPADRSDKFVWRNGDIIIVRPGVTAKNKKAKQWKQSNGM